MSSLVKHASPERDYTIIILHQGLSPANQQALAAYEKDKVKIEVRQLDDQLLPKSKIRRATISGPTSSPCRSSTVSLSRNSSRNTTRLFISTLTRS